MIQKKSFILMRDLLSTVELMTNEEAGILLKSIIDHVDGKEVKINRELTFAFTPIQNQLSRDLEKYDVFVEKQRVNGSKGGRPKNNPKNPSLSKETQKTQANPNNLDTVTDTVTDTVNETVTDIKNNIVNTKGVNGCPYQEIISLYHEKLPNNPQISLLSANRKTQIKARWNNGLPDIEAWKEYFDYVRASSFLTGRVQPTNGRKVFVANIDFLIKEGNVLKVFEGNYDD